MLLAILAVCVPCRYFMAFPAFVLQRFPQGFSDFVQEYPDFIGESRLFPVAAHSWPPRPEPAGSRPSRMDPDSRSERESGSITPLSTAELPGISLSPGPAGPGWFRPGSPTGLFVSWSIQFSIEWFESVMYFIIPRYEKVTAPSFLAFRSTSPLASLLGIADVGLSRLFPQVSWGHSGTAGLNRPSGLCLRGGTENVSGGCLRPGDGPVAVPGH